MLAEKCRWSEITHYDSDPKQCTEVFPEYQKSWGKGWRCFGHYNPVPHWSEMHNFLTHVLLERVQWLLYFLVQHYVQSHFTKWNKEMCNAGTNTKSISKIESVAVAHSSPSLVRAPMLEHKVELVSHPNSKSGPYVAQGKLFTQTGGLIDDCSAAGMLLSLAETPAPTFCRYEPHITTPDVAAMAKDIQSLQQLINENK